MYIPVLTPLLAMIFSCLATPCLAQASIYVRSSEDLRPLPYATVVNITKQFMLFSDENGMVSGTFDAGDSIAISYVGFASMHLRVPAAVTQTYTLKRSPVVLETVRLLGCKQVVKKEYTNLNADATQMPFGGVCCWVKGETRAKVAIMLKPDLEQFSIRSFSIWLQKGWGAPKGAIQTPLLFSFYSINDSTMLPGELISDRQVIYYPKKEGWQLIGVDSLDLVARSPGLYVSIEFIHDEKYEWPGRYIDSSKGVDSSFILYGSKLVGIYSKDFALAFYDHVTSTWSFPARRERSNLHEVQGTIKFWAELTTCKQE